MRPRSKWTQFLGTSRKEESSFPGTQDKLQAEEAQRKDSNQEWLDIEREVREEKRRLFAAQEFASGRRDTPVVGYDDVPDRPENSQSDEETEEVKEKDVKKGTGKETEEDIEKETSGFDRAIVTAGQQEREQRRGGQKKTGAQRRREAEEAAIQAGDTEAAAAAAAKRLKHGKKPKRREEEEADEDHDRWLKMRLEGEEKAKRIDATRVVSYFDFDSGGKLFDREQEDHERAAVPAASSTENFRASVRRDLWEDGDDSEG